MESGCELSSNADSIELVDPCLTKSLHNCKALAKTGKGGIHMDPTGSNPIGGLERPCSSWSPTNASECVLCVQSGYYDYWDRGTRRVKAPQI